MIFSLSLLQLMFARHRLMAKPAARAGGDERESVWCKRLDSIPRIGPFRPSRAATPRAFFSQIDAVSKLK